jgi:ABC-type polysaccharide/polyol phosphate export permease
VLFVLLAFYDRPLALSLALVPLLLCIQSVLTAGLSMIIATLNVFYRDVQHLTNIALMLLFYLTPVFYQPKAVSEEYSFIYSLNPLAVLMQDYRAIFFYGTAPEWGNLAFATITSIILFGLGYFIYDRKISDVIDAI